MFTASGKEMRDAVAVAAFDYYARLAAAWTEFVTRVTFWLTCAGWFGLDRRPLRVGSSRNPWEMHVVSASSKGHRDEAARRLVAAQFAAEVDAVPAFCAPFGATVEARLVLVPLKPDRSLQSIEAILLVSGPCPAEESSPISPASGHNDGNCAPAITIAWWKRDGPAGIEDSTTFTEMCPPSMLFAKILPAPRRRRMPN